MATKEFENQKNIILIADDDPDDRLLIKEAFEESNWTKPLHFVEDGVELLDYLFRRGKYADLVEEPLPDLILLDLNMPRKNGIEALETIKSDPELKTIPIIVFTTSKAEEDILRSYNLGVNSFITKPVSFDLLVDLTRSLAKYWFEIVKLPR
ncbi:MAG: response regulator [Bacillota bacterium]|jgi:CheY-like chemotaxis protein